jgi:hypothetical protein
LTRTSAAGKAIELKVNRIRPPNLEPSWVSRLLGEKVEAEAYPKIDFRIRSEASIRPPGKKRTTKMKIAPKMMR